MPSTRSAAEVNKHAAVQGDLQSSGRMRMPAGLHAVQMAGCPIL